MAEDKILEEISELKKLTLLGVKEALTLDDVSVMTGLSKSHIYKLTASKLIPFYKPNNKNLFFSKKEVEAWMLQGRVNTNTEAEQQAIAYCVANEKGGIK